MEKTIKLKIPKTYKILVMTVGDEEHLPTKDYLNQMQELLEHAIEKKHTHIVVPYWITLKVIE